MLHVPGGRKAATDYLDKLRLFKQNERVWDYRPNRLMSPKEPREVLSLSTNLPQFPTNTEWALVRRMCLISDDGNIQPSPLIESIQLRRYLRTDRGLGGPVSPTNGVQHFFEFALDKRHNAALRAIGVNEKGFPVFRSLPRLGDDPFEASYSVELQGSMLTCFQCHSPRGVYSVNSYTGFDLTRPAPANLPADLVPEATAVEASAAIYWKRQRYEWGLLEGLWRQNQ